MMSAVYIVGIYSISEIPDLPQIGINSAFVKFTTQEIHDKSYKYIREKNFEIIK